MRPHHNLENSLHQIGEQLRMLRLSRSEKLTTVANALHVHHATISRIENGSYNLTIDFLDKMLQHYDSSLDDFFVNRLHKS